MSAQKTKVRFVTAGEKGDSSNHLLIFRVRSLDDV